MNSLHNSHFDIVIVGAGPAGSTCAALLAREGIRVLLCDKSVFPREKICGDCINPGCWIFFELLGVTDEVARDSQIIKGVKITGRSGSILDIPFNEQLKVPFVAMKRSKLDLLLLNRALVDGVTFSEETILESINLVDGNIGEWKIGFRKRNGGGLIYITCKILVGADGRNSRVATILAGGDKAGNKWNGSGSRRVGVQLMVKRPNEIDSNVIMFFFDGGYGGIVSVSDAEANIAMVVSPELAHLATIDHQQFISRTIHSNQYGRTIAPHLESTQAVRTASPISPRGNRVHNPAAFLIGDARHTTEPFTGEGIYFAMQDGVRSANGIAKTFGLPEVKNSMTLKSRFWIDNVFSPILRNGLWVDRLLKVGRRSGAIRKLATKAVFG